MNFYGASHVKLKEDENDLKSHGSTVDIFKKFTVQRTVLSKHGSTDGTFKNMVQRSVP